MWYAVTWPDTDKEDDNATALDLRSARVQSHVDTHILCIQYEYTECEWILKSICGIE